MVIKNKSGIMRIVEAFLMVLLIMGVLLTLLSNSSNVTNGNAEKIYETEQSILRDVQLNNTLREDIFQTTGLPADWKIGTPISLENKIEADTPSTLTCEAKICTLGDECAFSKNINKNVYAQRAMMFSNIDIYAPRQLKLFCWENS